MDPGFTITDPILSPSECNALLATLSAVTRSRAGARHLMTHPAVAALARDPRLHSLAAQALGPNAIPYRATLFDKSQATNWLVPWHQDTALPLQSPPSAPGWGPLSTKAGILYAHAPSAALERIVALRLHLDECTSGNGPLRVIPGSHLLGVLSDDAVHRHAQANPAVECPAPLGAILAMRPLLIHASSKSRTSNPRRVLHIEYAASLEIAPGIHLAQA